MGKASATGGETIDGRTKKRNYNLGPAPRELVRNVALKAWV